MISTVDLLAHVRRALLQARRASSPAEADAILDAADCALHELMLRQSNVFYAQYVNAGYALLARARVLTPGADDTLASGDADAAPAGDAANSAPALHLIAPLLAALTRAIDPLDEDRSAQERALLIELSDWEASLYQHSASARPAGIAAPPSHFTQERWHSYLTARFPERKNLEVRRFEVLSGGFSKTTMLAETHDDSNGRQELVIRAEQAVPLLHFEGSQVAREFSMIQLMRRSGIPVAEPLWLETDRERLGARFIVSRRARGRTLGGNFGVDGKLPPAVLDAIISTLIQLHRVRINSGDALVRDSHLREWIPYSSVRAATHHHVAELMPNLLRKAEVPPSPLLARGLKWLERNLPESDEPAVIVHGDFALNNLIIDGDQVSAVLDWETSHLGDPAEDITWTQANLSAYIGMDELLQRYEAGTGRRVPQYRLAYAKVMGCAMSAITCLSAAHALATRADANIKFSQLTYRYMAVFGSQFNELIAAAEAVKGR